MQIFLEQATDLDLLAEIVKEMRSEHDAGDGHFSTKQVEFMEKLKSNSPHFIGLT
jgi:hypothetical protein